MTTVAGTSQQSFFDTLAAQSARSAAKESVQDRFLKLLVTQMRNQDPLNPLENAEVTTQLAQISTVTGIEKLNDSVGGMSSSFLAAQSLQAGALIGRGILGEGSRLVLEQGGATAGLVLDGAADRVAVTILKPNGEPVRTLQFSDVRAGTLTFSWDGSTDAGGTAPQGVYQFEVKASQQGRTVEAQRLGFGRVQSVTLGGSQLVLDTVGLGPVSLDQVKQILQ
jgi:flagellar basal-body rod modification protein FlgD